VKLNSKFRLCVRVSHHVNYTYIKFNKFSTILTIRSGDGGSSRPTESVSHTQLATRNSSITALWIQAQYVRRHCRVVQYRKWLELILQRPSCRSQGQRNFPCLAVLDAGSWILKFKHKNFLYISRSSQTRRPHYIPVSLNI
jgi:hypothetical protein